MGGVGQGGHGFGWGTEGGNGFGGEALNIGAVGGFGEGADGYSSSDVSGEDDNGGIILGGSNVDEGNLQDLRNRRLVMIRPQSG
jgi:hypothetical protein